MLAKRLEISVKLSGLFGSATTRCGVALTRIIREALLTLVSLGPKPFRDGIYIIPFVGLSAGLARGIPGKRLNLTGKVLRGLRTSIPMGMNLFPLTAS